MPSPASRIFCSAGDEVFAVGFAGGVARDGGSPARINNSLIEFKLIANTPIIATAKARELALRHDGGAPELCRFKPPVY
jgi:hypothetical protein